VRRGGLGTEGRWADATVIVAKNAGATLVRPVIVNCKALRGDDRYSPCQRLHLVEMMLHHFTVSPRPSCVALRFHRRRIVISKASVRPEDCASFTSLIVQ